MKKFAFLLFLLLAFACSKSNDPIVDMEEPLITAFLTVSPTQAFTHDILTITGENIDTTTTYRVTINNSKATVVDISSTELKVQIAKGTQGGPLEIVGPEVNEIMEAINILKNEEATFYAIQRSNESNSVVQLDINSGEVIEILRTFNLDEFSIRSLRYAPSINNLVLIGSTSTLCCAMGKLDLNTNTFSIHNNMYEVSNLEIGSDGRMFSISDFVFSIREFSIIDGAAIGEPLYSVGHPTSNGITSIHYFETQNKLIFNENITENGNSSSNYEMEIDLSDNSVSGTGGKIRYEDVNVSNDMIYSASYNKIGERLIGGEIQNPVETSFGPITRMDYSFSSDRLFFISNELDMPGQNFHLVRYHIPTAATNSLSLDNDIANLVVVN